MTEKQTYCEGCGRDHLKIHRVYKGMPYCGACYKRLFTRLPCRQCGQEVRLPSFDPLALCPKCMAFLPCVRCRRVGRPLGKITPHGPVCNSCSPYFRDKHPCDQCGMFSSRLSRHAGGQARLCPRCYAKVTKGCCAACRKQRKVERSTDGRLLCAACRTLGHIKCPECGLDMPAGSGKRCDSCKAKASLERRLKFAQAAFRVPEMASAYVEFGKWLGQEIGAPKAVLTGKKYLPFFLEIEQVWRDIPGYESLLHHFGAEGLRRYRLPMRWLCRARGICADEKLREQDSEERRIALQLAHFPVNTLASRTVLAYHEKLAGKVERGKTSLRSVRLALTPAIALLAVADPTGKVLPGHAHLKTYLRRSPGQWAALNGFVKYLNDTRNVRLSLPPPVQTSKVRQKLKAAARIQAYLRDHAGQPVDDLAWISVALPYFHNLTAGAGRRLSRSAVEAVEDGYQVQYEGQVYWIPRWPPDDLL